jgi:transcription termination/antitermination protein NusA
MLADDKGISVETLLHVLVDALARPTSGAPTPPTRSRSSIDPETMNITFMAYDIDEDGNWVNERDDTPQGHRPHRRADVPSGDEPAHP